MGGGRDAGGRSIDEVIDIIDYTLQMLLLTLHLPFAFEKLWPVPIKRRKTIESSGLSKGIAL